MGGDLKKMLCIKDILLVLIFKKEAGPPNKKQLRNQPNPDRATTTLALPIPPTLCVQIFDSDIPPNTAALEL